MRLSPNNFLQKFTFLIFTVLFLALGSFAQRDDFSLRSETIQNIEKDDLRGEDLSIRKAALQALGKRAGTVVVMSPQSGRIYSIVNQDWGIRRGFKPCSTIKLVTGIAGYNENLIKSSGSLTYGAYRLGLNDSLAYSNNTFFQRVGSKLGNKAMVRYSKRMGLGEPTGINARGEFAGRLPYNNGNLRIYSHADDFEVTPLQLAVLVSAITNGGDLVVPQIPRSRFSKTKFRGYYKRMLDLEPTVFERVIPGMIGAVKYGTAKGIHNSHLQIAGKTGSCISNKTWVGLFASVAPISDPKFAVVVITEGKYARGKYSAVIAGKIYQSLRNRMNENYRGTLAKMNVPAQRESTFSSKSKSRRIVINNPVAKNTRKKSLVTPKKKSKPSKSIAKKRKKKKKAAQTIIIEGKAEITRPRVVGNR